MIKHRVTLYAGTCRGDVINRRKIKNKNNKNNLELKKTNKRKNEKKDEFSLFYNRIKNMTIPKLEIFLRGVYFNKKDCSEVNFQEYFNNFCSKGRREEDVVEIYLSLLENKNKTSIKHQYHNINTCLKADNDYNFCPVCRKVLLNDINSFNHLLKCLKPSTKDNYKWLKKNFLTFFMTGEDGEKIKNIIESQTSK